MSDGKINPGRHLRTGYMDLSLGCLERKWAKKTGWSENGLFVKKGHLRRAIKNTVATLNTCKQFLLNEKNECIPIVSGVSSSCVSSTNDT